MKPNRFRDILRKLEYLPGPGDLMDYIMDHKWARILVAVVVYIVAYLIAIFVLVYLRTVGYIP